MRLMLPSAHIMLSRYMILWLHFGACEFSKIRGPKMVEL